MAARNYQGGNRNYPQQSRSSFSGFTPYVHTPQFVGQPVDEYKNFYKALDDANKNIVGTIDDIDIMLSQEDINPAYGDAVKRQRASIDEGINNILESTDYRGAMSSLRQMSKQYVTNPEMIGARKLTQQYRAHTEATTAAYNRGDKNIAMYEYENMMNQPGTLDEYNLGDGQFADWKPRYNGSMIPKDLQGTISKYIAMYKPDSTTIGNKSYPTPAGMTEDDKALGLYPEVKTNVTKTVSAENIENFVADRLVTDPKVIGFLQEEADILNSKIPTGNPETGKPYTADDMARVHINGVKDAVEYKEGTYSTEQTLAAEKFNAAAYVERVKNNTANPVDGHEVTITDNAIEIGDNSSDVLETLGANTQATLEYVKTLGNLSEQDAAKIRDNGYIAFDILSNYYNNSPTAKRDVRNITLKMNEYLAVDNYDNDLGVIDNTKAATQNINNSLVRTWRAAATAFGAEYEEEVDNAPVRTDGNYMISRFADMNNLWKYEGDINTGLIDETKVLTLLQESPHAFTDVEMFKVFETGKNTGGLYTDRNSVYDMVSKGANIENFNKNFQINQKSITAVGTDENGDYTPFMEKLVTNVIGNPDSYMMKGTDETFGTKYRSINTNEHDVTFTPMYTGFGVDPLMNVSFSSKNKDAPEIKPISIYPNTNSTAYAMNFANLMFSSRTPGGERVPEADRIGKSLYSYAKLKGTKGFNELAGAYNLNRVLNRSYTLYIPNIPPVEIKYDKTENLYYGQSETGTTKKYTNFLDLMMLLATNMK